LGVAQMAICIVTTTVATIAFVDGWTQAVFLGFLVAHTSSTLMLKLFLDRGEIETPQVRLGLGISITQDLSAVPMLLTIPTMAGVGNGGIGELVTAFLKAALVFGAAVALSRWVIPFWMHHVVRSRSRELLLLFLFTICLGMAWATTALGLPVALGAFLGGLAIAGSEYRHQTLAEIVPFRDLLVALFFISIGMLLELTALPHFAVPALLVIPAILLLKFLSGAVPVLAAGYPLRIATLVGVAMAQIGEFSFVLAHTGHDAQLIDDNLFQFFVLISIATMLANPFLIGAGPRLARRLASLRWLSHFEGRTLPEETAQAVAWENHVVVAGYGLNGRNIAQTLRSLSLPHVVLDLNPDAVRAARKEGESVRFGDCTRAEILRKANIGAARVYVVAVSDPRATRQTVQVARHENPKLHIIARTKYLSEIEPLRRLGADVVISEEFETSLEILSRTLDAYELPQDRIEEIVRLFRGETYEALRGKRAATVEPALFQAISPELQIESIRIPAGSPAAGRDLRQLNLRVATGATLLAVQRNGHTETLPSADFTLQEGDVAVLAGLPQQIQEARRFFAAS
jgi:CPA2 family monovalent cation:H+ antiporter-2